MTESMSVSEIASVVAAAYPGSVTVENLANPRVEAPEHYWQVKHTALVDLGLEPHLLSETLIESLFSITKRYAHRVRPEALRPTVDWRKPAPS
jgi:UDP-sulfoquinovose synthase